MKYRLIKTPEYEDWLSSAGLIAYSPTKELLDEEFIALAIWECLKNNDPEGVVEVIQAHLDAEGAGEYAPDEKARFYRIAKRSATECAGVLDVCQRLELVEEKRYTTGRELLINIVSMLVKMVQRH